MQRFPPTVAVFQILNEARNARQHWLMRGAASHSTGQTSASSSAMVQVAFEIAQIDQSQQMGLRFGEQPGPAREPSIACRPNGQLRPVLRPGHFGDGIQVHG
jgi:hypothetical protein